jgi:Tfp pilus assembly major pilin PilA
MRERQQGITAIGFIILAAIIGLFGFAGLKLVPVYLENMKVTTLLEDISGDLEGEAPTATKIRSAIGKRLNIEMIYNLKTQDFEVSKTSAGFRVRAKYESRVSFLGNLYLVAVFDDAVEINR